MNSKGRALKKIVLKRSRKLTAAERREKMENWPKSSSEKVDTLDYQRRIGRAYND